MVMMECSGSLLFCAEMIIRIIEIIVLFIISIKEGFRARNKRVKLNKNVEKLKYRLGKCKKFSKDDILKQQDVCAICLDEFKKKKQIRVLNKCHHVFHLKCIDKWIMYKYNCPLCNEEY